MKTLLLSLVLSVAGDYILAFELKLFFVDIILQAAKDYIMHINGFYIVY